MVALSHKYSCAEELSRIFVYLSFMIILYIFPKASIFKQISLNAAKQTIVKNANTFKFLKLLFQIK